MSRDPGHVGASEHVAAVHEAGHTIVALCIGGGVTRVIAKSIGNATVTLRGLDTMSPLHRAAYYLAGDAAEMKVLGGSDSRTGNEDRARVAELRLPEDDINRAQALAECCLAINESELDKVIGRLQQSGPGTKKSLDSDELGRLVDVQPCPDPQDECVEETESGTTMA